MFTTSDADWVVDSGAPKYMSGTRSVFSSMSSSVSTPSVTVTNGTHSPIHGQGNVSLPNNLTLRDVLYVSNFRVNLLSVSQLTKTHHYAITLFPTYLLIQDCRLGNGLIQDLRVMVCTVSMVVGHLQHLLTPCLLLSLLFCGTVVWDIRR